MKVLIIIPAYNEELNILKTVEKIVNIKSNDAIDYIIINDGSTDKTQEICQKEKLNAITLISNLGIGGAVQTGYKYAYYNDYDIAIQFDGDGQHDEKYINTLIEEIKRGNDFVIGSRFIGNLSEFKSSTARKVGIKLLSILIKVFGKIKITDPTSGFRAANKKVIKLFAENYPTEYPEPETIIYLKNKEMKIKEIPVEMHERQHGKSSIKPLNSAYYMFSVSIAIFINGLFGKRGEK